MTLRAKKPEAVTKRLKLFMFGPSGVGKTTAAVQFPRPYIIDCERGTENYDKLITSVGGAVFGTVDCNEVLAEVKALLTEKHDYRSLVIDPITPVYNDLLEKGEAKVGTDHGRHYGFADKYMRRLTNLLMALDMNVVMTAHAKVEYGPNLAKLGLTFDGWKRLDYLFDLVVELRKVGKGKAAKRVGVVVKTRLEGFPDSDEFPWSYEEIAKRYDAKVMERESAVLSLASPAQVRQMKELLALVRLPEGTVEKWFTKAGVEQDVWEDMPADVIGKCIEYVKGRLPGGAAAGAVS